MDNIHIALVGGQTSPVYYGAFQINPDRIILICSTETAGEASRLKGLLARVFQVDIQVIDPSNLTKIEKSAKEIRQRIPDDSCVSINLVGGTKFWSLVFYREFSSRPNTDFYLFDQNGTMWNLEKMESEPPYLDIDIQEHLELYGNPVISFKPLTEYTAEDFDAIKKIEAIWRVSKRAVFNRISATLSKEQQKELDNNVKGTFYSGNSFLSWEKPDQITFSIDSQKIGTTHIVSPHAISLATNCGWFELKIAEILSKWKRAKDIYLNCVFPLRESTNNPKNEVDIIVNAKTKLLFVECKIQIHNSTDIDKFATVVKNYGGSGCKALFITFYDMRNLDLQKCKESGILAFSLKDHSIEELFFLLDQNLDTINK